MYRVFKALQSRPVFVWRNARGHFSLCEILSSKPNCPVTHKIGLSETDFRLALFGRYQDEPFVLMRCLINWHSYGFTDNHWSAIVFHQIAYPIAPDVQPE